ncbi:hypothetical protein LSAT2_001831 [Lamellibrachia satsuma]|nr:hypothetical protein LSAT2_001831 [Lamellibrachia satsuma]
MAASMLDPKAAWCAVLTSIFELTEAKWRSGWRCIHIDREKSLTAAIKPGKLYLTLSFLCFARHNPQPTTNIKIRLADITRIKKAPWRAQESTLESERRYPGGQEKVPWRAIEGTLEDKRRYPGGQEKVPWRAREVTLEDKRRYPGGREKVPWRTREGTLEGKRRYPGG